jgi:hypothetical protein
MHTTQAVPRRARFASALLLLALGGVACSVRPGPPKPPARPEQGPQDPKLSAAFAHCLAEQGLSPPPAGVPHSPPKDARPPDRDKLDACLAGQGRARPPHGPNMPPGPPPMPEGPSFRQALVACAAEQGLPPPPAPDAKPQARPADARRPDRDRLDACLEAKGVTLPPPPPGPPAPPLPPNR